MRMVWLQQCGLIASQKLKNGSFWNQQIYKRSLNKIAIFLTFLTLLFHIIKGGGVYSNDHFNIRHPMHRGGGVLTSVDPIMEGRSKE